MRNNNFLLFKQNLFIVVLLSIAPFTKAQFYFKTLAQVDPLLLVEAVC